MQAFHGAVRWRIPGTLQVCDGTYKSEYYTFIPDTPPVADWFVHSFYPDNMQVQYFTDGPYTEQGARSKAQDSAAKSPRNTYSVYQVLAGNTVKVIPPTHHNPK